MKKIELLAPAKNLESGIAAINFGADAVYIGSQKFGARLAAGNSLSDIKQLCEYAHKFNAKVYITLNTIFHDEELSEVQSTINQLYENSADAIIIQDMGILEMDLPPIPLFASTQTHNYSWEKVKFLEDVGLKRVILARELSLNQIKEIRSKTNIELEFFVHGALCVSLSGQCYFSHAIDKGSANRGACAQPCRAYYSLKDSTNKTLIQNKHLLSLKDLNLTDHISELIDSGITSFKIEGRLKDISYVKNITAHYRKHIDLALENKTGFIKQSSGKIYADFNPDTEKTFNRGYSNYFLKGRSKEIASFDSPKSIGKEIGKIKSVFEDYFTIESNHELRNGDGICFFDESGILQGLNINKAEKLKVFIENTSNLKPGIAIYRNHDHTFNKLLTNSKTARKISVKIEMGEIENGISIKAKDSDNTQIDWNYKKNKEIAKNEELALSNIRKQLSKSGDSIFTVEDVDIRLNTPLFFPVSELNEIRRKTFELLENERVKNYQREEYQIEKTSHEYPEKNLDYKGNVLNKNAINFYKRHGVEQIESALETQTKFDSKEIMTTMHCIKYEIGACEKYSKNPVKIQEPLYLEDNNRRYELKFDCDNCLMKVIML
jgi:putative protease